MAAGLEAVEGDLYLKGYFMRSYDISDVNKLRLLFEEAFSSCGYTDEGDYDEYIAVIAEGRIDELPEDIRKKVLDRISFDEGSAEMLKELCRVEGSQKSDKGRGYFRVLSITWAAAACLMFGLFVWRIADPAPPTTAIKPPTPMSEDDDSYWEQVNEKRLATETTRYRVRDYALAGSITATCILSLVILAEKLKSGNRK